MSGRALFTGSLSLALAGLLGLASRPGAAQAPAGDAQATFGESIDVRVLNVEAVVTAKDGSRVRGLAAKDFRLVVDGKPVAVEFFTEISDGAALGPEGEGVSEGETPGAARGPVPTRYLVFIDDYFGVQQRRDEVIRSLADTVAQMGPGDRMAVVAFDGSRLATLSPWTASRDALRQAFDQAVQRPARGLDRVNEARRHFADEGWVSEVEEITESGAEVSSPWMNLRQVAYAEVLVRELKSEVVAISDTLRAFAAGEGGGGEREGRRVMLLLSGGWPMSVQAFVGGDPSKTPNKEIVGGEEIFRPLTNTANLLGYTIYPVDVPGLEGRGDGSSSLAGVRMGPGDRQQELEASLQFLAQETGGKPLFNSNRLTAFQTAVADTRSYYWLGFSPTWKRNDVRHTIKVEVLKPGLQVRSRNGFLDLSKRAEVSMRVESAVRFGTTAGDATLAVEAGTPVPLKKGFEVPLTLSIPTDIVTALPEGDRFVCRLDLRIVATGEDGSTSDMPVTEVKFGGRSAPQPGQLVRYTTKVTLLGKAKELVVAVYDPLSGKLASGKVALPQPEAPAK